MNKKNIEKAIFIPTMVVTLLVSIILLLFPVKSREGIDWIFDFLTVKFGWMYLLTGCILVLVSLFVAFSKYGNIKLSYGDEKKEYSNWSWAAMLFTSGMGVEIVLLGFTEPISFLKEPPLNAAPMSESAFVFSHAYDQFIYGFYTWAIYGAGAAAVAYTLYRKRDSFLRLSNVCSPVLGRQTNGFAGKTIDILVMLGMIGGISTSLGLGTPTVTMFIEYLTGIPQSNTMTVIVMLMWAGVFGTSVYLGLDKGIKRLSDFNLYLLAALMLVVLFAMPISQFFVTEGKSLWAIVTNIKQLSLSNLPGPIDKFSQQWSVFYLAWWMGFFPIMVLFGARISRGRTVRQVILGFILYGGGGSMLSTGIFGAYSLYLQKNNILDVQNIMETMGREKALIAILETLPMGKICVILTLILVFIFLATTIDSTAYMLASICSKKLTGDSQPTRVNRISWASVLLFFALSLVFIGGLQTVQTASIVLGFPMIFVSLMLVVSMFKMYNKSNTLHK